MQQLIEFLSNHMLLTSLLVAIVLALYGTSFINQIRGIKQVGPTDATQMINHDDALVIDVRENNEYADGHIINAIHIPMANVQQRISELEKYKDKPIIVSCRTGARSATVCGWLKKHKFENVSNLKGGVMAWQNASLPLSKK